MRERNARMEEAMSAMESEFAHIDENDPKAMGRMMRRMAELTGEKLIGIVDKLTKDPAELMVMGAKARALAQPDSLDKICENLDQLMKTTA